MTGYEAKRQPATLRRSLAATHPSNYAQATTMGMPPPPSKIQKPKTSKSSKTTDSVYAQNSADTYPTPSPSPPKSTQAAKSFHTRPACAATKQAQSQSVNTTTKPVTKLPWLEHTDPMFTTSDRPCYWSRNHTTLKSDTDLTYGSVLSPTFMHGLPFGTMIEVAHHYPSEEGGHGCS